MSDTWHPDIPLEWRNQIITGDARVLTERIPDESISLILTDPVYDRMDDYRWLGEEAARILKPDTSLLAFCSIGLLGETISALSEASGLSYRWLLTANFAGRRLFYGKLHNSMMVCVWMQKGKGKLWGIVGDSTTLPPIRPARYLQGDGASWDKHPKIMRMYVNAFCPEGGIIFDPFAGLGSTPAYAMALGRNYLAFEIQPDIAERARERVANTQPPLPLAIATQETLL